MTFLDCAERELQHSRTVNIIIIVFIIMILSLLQQKVNQIL